MPPVDARKIYGVALVCYPNRCNRFFILLWYETCTIEWSNAHRHLTQGIVCTCSGLSPVAGPDQPE